VVKILITGGACAGKTEIIQTIRNEYQNRGYNVFILNEIPTQLIINNITSQKIGKKEFIELIIKMYLDIDANYNRFLINTDNNIILYDGSPLDVLKFISKNEFNEIAKKFDTSFNKIINYYDKIIFLETIAKKYPELYTVENNIARLNDIKMAVERNDILANYYKNTNYTYIEGCSDFREKRNNVIKAIDEILK